MLKLKKLQILGFKSFCDRTELNFHGEGIAAVVGPNGCGKSNISDAISWVLGEQSAKSLRGIQMQDVIFAGTRERKPTGMAEVSLTLIDPEVYNGSSKMEPEIEIKDDLDDWDEASLRAGKARQTEEAILEVQPGKVDADGNPIIEPEVLTAGDGPEPEDAEGEGAADPEKVVLKIRRRKFKSNQFSAGEIVVTRRLFRSGDSEYLLNGKLCRLRDIQDLFMGTGLGPESYAIIEQGRIGQILSSKPYDRRAIIEEAAGITKYKTRKRLAELRLEQAKQNLSRVNDIFDEVSRQMNSLKRQASKAERYGKLRDEMRAKLRVVLASKFSQLSKEASGIEEEIKRLSEELLTKTTDVEQMEAAHTQGMERGYAIEAEVKANAGQINALALEMDRSSARSRHNDERCSELGARTAISHAELERTVNNLQSLESERESNRGIVESAAADVMAARDEATLKQQQAASASGKLGEVERLQEARRSGLMEVMSRAGRVRNQTTQAEEHIAALDREARRIDTESEGALRDIEALGGQRGQITMEFESHTEKVSGLTRRIEEGRAQLNAKRQEETEGKKNLDVLRAEYATALGKRNSLEAIIAEHGYSTESVKRLFQSGAFENGNAPVGVLADFLEVEGQHEVVVDEFLRDELNYIVVKSWDAANEGMRLLKSDVDGRATFLVHPSDSQAKFSFVADESLHYAPTRDAIVPLKNCIRVLNGFGKSLEVILPKLGNGYITPDSAIARELALENPDAFFLSPSGECFHNVTVTGGKQRSEGPLSLKRELREVLRVLSGLEAAIAADQFKVQILSREIVELTAMLDSLQEEKREAEKQALTSGHALRQMESELTRVEQRLCNYRVERDRLVSQRREKEGLVAKFSEEAAEYEARRAAIESEVQTAQETLANLRQERDSAAQSAAETSARLATLEERRRGAVSALDRIETLAVEVSKRMESLKTEIASAEAEKAQRASENVQIAERLVILGAEREKAQAAAAALHEESRLVRARIAELDQQLKGARQELNLVRDRRGDLLAAIARLKSDEEYMAQSCVNDLGLSAEELRADTGLALFEGDQLGAEDQAYREMRTRLEAMGPVNMMALEEYKETAQRYEFLETQRKDLLDSIENTQSTIKEIDGVSRQKFQEAFEKINENFQVSFRKLFGGGQGFMKLTDIENSAESGIDIVASPPGKKLQNVLLLSGGEKALTALALLVGIFQYQPSPFCILDEVDAPLDEANVGRFNDMVKEMSGQTQFILITHSKRTMSNAPVMYGVTMQEPGVSKVVSVKFGEEPRLVAATA